MRNVEVKVRLHDRAAVEQRLASLHIPHVATLHQRDVFFVVPHGRLKIRFVDDSAELIHYRRRDTAQLRDSDYERCAVADAETLCRVLARALPQAGEVRKVRHLYVQENVRIHLDAVEDLGEFLEIEAVVDAQHDGAACRSAAEALLDRLDLAEESFEALAYVDLLRG